MTILPERIRSLRQSAQMTQKKLAELLEVNESTVCQYETGQRKPSYEVLERLCEVFCVSADYLLGVEEHACLRLSAMQLRESQLALILSLIQEYRRP